MRAFIILALAAAAVVNAEVGGYNYAATSAGGGNGGASYGGIAVGGGGGGVAGGYTGSAGNGGVQYGAVGGGAGGQYGGVSGGAVGGGAGAQYGGVSGGGGGAVDGGAYGGDNVVSIGGGGANQGAVGGHGGGAVGPENIEFSKEFFTYSAPESEFDDGKSAGDLAASMKRNLRVIFIRAPGGDNVADAALNLAKSASEQRTAIYVLTKQADLGELAEKLRNLKSQSGASRPEVHFVKYRTPEDAANAQQTIQQQFNSLPGHSQSHDGGVAQVLNFASKSAPIAPAQGHGGQVQQQLPQQQQQVHHQQQQQQVQTGGHAVQSPSNGYIAPSGGGVSVGSPSATYLPIFKH